MITYIPVFGPFRVAGLEKITGQNWGRVTHPKPLPIRQLADKEGLKSYFVNAVWPLSHFI